MLCSVTLDTGQLLFVESGGDGRYHNSQPLEGDLSANMNSSLDFLLTYKPALIFIYVCIKKVQIVVLTSETPVFRNNVK